MSKTDNFKLNSNFLKKVTARSVRGEAGFSLLEILLAVVIIGFIVLTIANIPSSLQLIGKSRYSSLARDIVSQEIETVRAQGYASLANGTASFTDNRLFSLPNGAGQVVVADCPLTICKSGEQTKQVSVSVTWLENKSGTKNVSVTTLISDGGLK